MCEGILGGGLIYLNQELKPGLVPISIGGEIVIIDLSGYTEEQIREIENLWGENDHGMPQQNTTYMGISFEFEPLCPKKWAREE